MVSPYGGENYSAESALSVWHGMLFEHRASVPVVLLFVSAPCKVLDKSAESAY